MANPNPEQEELFARLEQLALAADQELAWPLASWECARGLSALEWSIASAFGGMGLAGIELLDHYERLATSCLTTCFILSQRDSACRRIRDHGSEELCRELLPPLARGDTFSTVGLSHLTTSRQHLQPAMLIRDQGDHLLVQGMMPWVTAASHADYFVTGGVLENDGRQVLLILPRDLAGVSVGQPLDLMALAGSITAEVHCDRVSVPKKWLLAGPAERVLASGRGGTGGLETSCLALGLVAAALNKLQKESKTRAELRPSWERLDARRQGLRRRMHDLSLGEMTAKMAADLRGEVNTLVLAATQATLIAGKGTGFLRDHPAQRWARQALFFLVWSCPWPAAESTLARLAFNVEESCLV